MGAFLSALGSGISAKKILDYLMRKSPELKPKITSALASGLSAEKILSFFSKDQNFEKLKSSMQDQYQTENNANPLVQAENIRSKNLGSDMASGLQRQAPQLLGTAAALGTSYALSRAIPKILQPAGGISPQTIQGQIQSQTPTIPQTSQIPIIQNDATSIAQPTNTEKLKEILNPKEFLEKNGLLETVEELLKRGNTPEQAAAALGIQRSGNAKIDPELLANIEEYAKKTPIDEKISLETEKQESKNPIISKKEIVASPQGIGEVKEIRNGKALVEIDGKLHKIDVEDLEGEAEDVIQTVQDLLKIPEIDKSSIVSLFTYDPDERKMYIQFHTGDTYKYLDVDPEKVLTVANKMGIPVTQGKNIFGAWSPKDKKSLGATLIKEVINDPKYKKPNKGEPSNPNYIKLETLYDYWENLRKKPKRKI